MWDSEILYITKNFFRDFFFTAKLNLNSDIKMETISTPLTKRLGMRNPIFLVNSLPLYIFAFN